MNAQSQQIQNTAQRYRERKEQREYPRWSAFINCQNWIYCEAGAPLVLANQIGRLEEGLNTVWQEMETVAPDYVDLRWEMAVGMGRPTGDIVE